MNSRIDEYNDLARILQRVANQNRLAVTETCKAIAKSNGTIKKAMSSIIKRGTNNE